MRKWPALAVLGAALIAVVACGPKPTPEPVVNPVPPTERELTGPPLFDDVTATCGISFEYRNGEDTANHMTILESLGGGVGLLDFDGDGLLDVFITGGGGFEGPEKKTIVGRPCRLYRNLGAMKFADVTGSAGLTKLAGGKPWCYSHGVAVADYDRDGWPDLLVTGWGAVALFRNVPVDPGDPKKGRRFEDVTAQAKLDQGITWSTSAAFADFDGDGFPDLYVCQYVDWSWAKNPPCTYDGKTPDVCPPKSFHGLPHKVFRNTGRGSFEDVSATAGLLPGGPEASKGLGVLAVDLNSDGKPDVYVANDTVANFLYLNESKPGAIRFRECGVTSGAALDDRGNPNGSMGADAGDPERTGKLHLWVTNYENELHALYRSNGRAGTPSFEHRTASAEISTIGQKYVGWGTGFLDADLDGWEDIFVANGHAVRFPIGSTRKQRPVLLMNQGGKFQPARRIGTYGEHQHLSRGVAFGDLDNDGRTDLVISHTNEPVSVLRGVGGQDRHWFGVELIRANNASTIGARVTIQIGDTEQSRFRKAGGSYASSGDPRLLFGCGTSQVVNKLTVSWPDGKTQQFENLPVDRYIRIMQDEAAPRLGSGKE